VQGVGFRRFAQKQADGLRLAGWARNHYDGRVEVLVAGDEAVLDQYCDLLKKGPVFSQVREVVVTTVEDNVSKVAFEILPDVEMK